MRKILIFFVGVFVASAAFATDPTPPSSSASAVCYNDYSGTYAGKCEGKDTLEFVNNHRMSWAKEFDKDGIEMTGYSVCSPVSGASVGAAAGSADADNLDSAYLSQSSGGGYPKSASACWCKMIGPAESSWISGGDTKDADTCVSTCGQICTSTKTPLERYMYANLITNQISHNPWDEPTNDADNTCYSSWQGVATSGDCGSDSLGFIGHNPLAWAAEFVEDNIYVTGYGVCSALSGSSNEIATGSTATTLDAVRAHMFAMPEGKTYCWCKMIGPAESSWVYPTIQSLKACGETCGSTCASSFGLNSSGFRDIMYSTIPRPRMVTTQSYVDHRFHRKQKKITTTGLDKLMLYGASAGAILARDIVATLGNNTNATTVSTTGAVVTGVNTKQDALNGTNGWVATGTGDPVVFGQKPVYATATGQDDGYSAYTLMPASDVNTIATDAANNELVCARYAANAALTPANCLLWKLAPYDVAVAAMPNLRRGFLSRGEICTEGNECRIGNQCLDGVCVTSSSFHGYGTGESCEDDTNCYSGRNCVGRVLDLGITVGYCAPAGCGDHNVACNLDRDCCTGVCDNGKCTHTVVGKRAKSFYCTNNTQCASGNCNDSRCSGDYNRPGIPCSLDSDCTSGVCYDGRCRADCVGNGTACSTNGDCCSGICANGTCAAACATIGNWCSKTSDCCTGKCVKGACYEQTSCLEETEECTAQGECCEGLYCAFGGKKLQCTACLLDGSKCKYDYECCSGTCNEGACAVIK